jgi:two-component system, OmpR family, phosphate regulon sensor histidine kinase PhoR
MIDPLAAAAFEALLRRRGVHLLLLVDDDLRIVRAGAEAARLAERRQAALPGMSLIAAFGSASLDELARDAASSRIPQQGSADLGHLGEHQFAVDVVPLPRGGLVVSLHDVTAVRRMERARRDFVANISHELRTPLTSIKLLAETLASGTFDDSATMHDFAIQIEREADHLAQLVDELLELSTIESGELRLSLESISPDVVVAACVERIQPVAERRGIRVRRLPGPDETARVSADPERLGQAMLNLSHNAVKYSRRDSEIRIGWERRGDRVRLLVADDGIGIPRSHQARIFERFYKVDRSRARDETDRSGSSAGLGLAIVRHLAEAHGGTVGVESQERVGSTFWIDLPIAGTPTRAE